VECSGSDNGWVQGFCNIMNIIDICILFVLLVLCIKGYVKGFIHEVFSLMIILFGIIVSLLFYRPVSSALGIFIENSDLSLVLSFIALFILTTIVLVIIRNALSSIVESLNITDVDSVLGLLIGALKGVLLSSFLLVFFNYHRVLRLNRVIEASFFYPYFERFLLAILSLLPDTIYSTILRFLGVY